MVQDRQTTLFHQKRPRAEWGHENAMFSRQATSVLEQLQ